MIAALLNLARAEVEEYGFITHSTRQRLYAIGVMAVNIERYLSAVGVN